MLYRDGDLFELFNVEVADVEAVGQEARLYARS